MERGIEGEMREGEEGREEERGLGERGGKRRRGEGPLRKTLERLHPFPSPLFSVPLIF